MLKLESGSDEEMIGRSQHPSDSSVHWNVCRCLQWMSTALFGLIWCRRSSENSNSIFGLGMWAVGVGCGGGGWWWWWWKLMLDRTLLKLLNYHTIARQKSCGERKPKQRSKKNRELTLSVDFAANSSWNIKKPHTAAHPNVEIILMLTA